MIDPLDKVEVLIDRNQQYRVILDSELAIEGNHGSIDSVHLSQTKSIIFIPILDKVFTPTFVELTSTDRDANSKALKEHGVHFPFGNYYDHAINQFEFFIFV